MLKMTEKSSICQKNSTVNELFSNFKSKTFVFKRFLGLLNSTAHHKLLQLHFAKYTRTNLPFDSEAFPGSSYYFIHPTCHY